MKDNKKQEIFKLLYRMTRNLITLAFVFSLFLVLFFITGNFQGFQDSTQSLILSTLGITSIFFAIVSVIGLVESLLFFFIKSSISLRRNIFFFLISLICIAISVSFIAMSLVLGVLTEGL